MRAVVYTEYGSPDVLSLAEVETPVPADDELLVRIHAVSVNGSDAEGLAGRPLYSRMTGLRKPSHPILGSDIAGRVEAVGGSVTEFAPGDDVFGELPGYRGGFAEYVATNGRTLARKPASLTFEEAAALPQGGVIALNGIVRKGRVSRGQRVLVNGAGGSAGCYAIQLAKREGAEVTGVDSEEKLDFMRSLGADHVLDYTREDFTRTGKRYDLVLDLVARRSVFAYGRALARGGTAFFVGGSVATLFQVLLLGPLLKTAARRSRRILVVNQSREDLQAVTALCESGALRPVVDRIVPFSQTPDAMRYVAGGHAKGKVVITVVAAGTTPPGGVSHPRVYAP